MKMRRTKDVFVLPLQQVIIKGQSTLKITNKVKLILKKLIQKPYNKVRFSKALKFNKMDYTKPDCRVHK